MKEKEIGKINVNDVLAGLRVSDSEEEEREGSRKRGRNGERPEERAIRRRVNSSSREEEEEREGSRKRGRNEGRSEERAIRRRVSISNEEGEREKGKGVLVVEEEEEKEERERSRRFTREEKGKGKVSSVVVVDEEEEEEEEVKSPSGNVEDWPGPFSTAMKIIRDREKKGVQDVGVVGKGGASSLVSWVPKSRGKNEGTKRAVPSLRVLCLRILVDNVDAISSLDGVPDVLRHKLSQMVCDSRRMNEHFLGLLLKGSPSEIRLADCSWLEEDKFENAFEDCDTSNLTVLPGPFSTAMKIIRDREKSLGGGGVQDAGVVGKGGVSSLVSWIPKSRGKDEGTKRAVPSLQVLCLRILVDNVDAITSLDCVPDVLRHKLSQMVCDSGRMNEHFLGLLLKGCPSEIRLADCSLLEEDKFENAFEDCDTSNLTVLQLAPCGHFMSDSSLPKALGLKPLNLLTTLSLKGACRISDVGMRALISSAPSLKSVNLSQCTLLTKVGINDFTNSLNSFHESYLDDCEGLDAMRILPGLEKLSPRNYVGKPLLWTSAHLAEGNVWKSFTTEKVFPSTRSSQASSQLPKIPTPSSSSSPALTNAIQSASSQASQANKDLYVNLVQTIISGFRRFGNLFLSTRSFALARECGARGLSSVHGAWVGNPYILLNTKAPNPVYRAEPPIIVSRQDGLYAELLRSWFPLGHPWKEFALEDTKEKHLNAFWFYEYEKHSDGKWANAISYVTDTLGMYHQCDVSSILPTVPNLQYSDGRIGGFVEDVCSTISDARNADPILIMRKDKNGEYFLYEVWTIFRCKEGTNGKAIGPFSIVDQAIVTGNAGFYKKASIDERDVVWWILPY